MSARGRRGGYPRKSLRSGTEHIVGAGFSQRL